MLPLIIFLLNKEEYIKYSSFIYESIYKEEQDVKDLFFLLKKMYEDFPTKASVTVDEFVAFVKATKPDNLLIDVVASQDIGNDVLEHLIVKAKQQALAHEVALLAVDVSEGKKDVDTLLTKVKEFDTIDVPAEEFEFVTDNLEELYAHNVATPGLRWRLRTLNEMLGSLRRGNFGFVFARPESGKTTFLASEVSHFATQAEQPILWFNNEQEGEEVRIRIYQATLGIPDKSLFADRAKNQDLYQQLTGGRIKLIDQANIHYAQIERMAEKYQPACIVIDQIDKLKGFNADREDLRLGSIYVWARELAKAYCPVIGVCQADGSGEGKKWLTMENVSNAKTSKQAEADWILGIGKTNDAGYEYVRHLHLSKNKLRGDEDTIPELRHGRRDVVIQPEIARYKDV